MSKFSHLIDLASARLGGAAVVANDDFFAPKENLLKPEAPIFLADKYTDRGKWMDGWETRRRRQPGHDWCIVKLGLPGVVKSVIVDTAFFRGNFPSHCSIDGCGIGHDADASALGAAPWRPLLGQQELRGDAQNVFQIDDAPRVTHLRLNIFPDGGVARLRVFGEATPDWRRVLDGSPVDLAAITLGAHVVDTSDHFFGAPLNLLMPYPAINMGDGWETKRRRGPGHDWVVIRLALEGVIRRVELDTAHFKGNYPDSCSMEAAVVEDVAGTVSADLTSTVIGQWRPLLARMPLQADRLHTFESELSAGVTATHVRLNIFPDGGVSRLRIFGDPTTGGRQRAVLQLFNQMDDGELREAMADYSAAPTWIDRMAKGRPYANAAALLAAADSAADAVPSAEWLEAFRHHPRIGERTAERAQSTIAAGASATEQSGMAGATAAESADLADANRAYEDRFGHVFIISAAGKSPQDVLTSLRSRLGNDPATELDVAVAEQRRITRLRLERLLG